MKTEVNGWKRLRIEEYGKNGLKLLKKVENGWKLKKKS